MWGWRRIVLSLAGVVIGLSRVDSAEPATAFEHHRIGKALVSLPEGWKTWPARPAVWLHLHGAPAVMESSFTRLGAPGVLINVTLPGHSKVYADYFADPAVFIALMSETEALFRRLAPEQPWRTGRLTVSSFSAGFGGVRQLLRQSVAFERIAVLVMADSLYCGYAGSAADKAVDEELMSGFLRFARLAAEGRKRFILSHSRQVPEGYASTTETADYLLRKLQGERRAAPAGDWPAGLRLETQYSVSGFEVLGFAGDAPEDHLRHLRGIGALIQRGLGP